jgi:hypothetical protein
MLAYSFLNMGLLSWKEELERERERERERLRGREGGRERERERNQERVLELEKFKTMFHFAPKPQTSPASHPTAAAWPLPSHS